MTTALWLSAYFTLNLALTLYNKLVLIHFPFPYTLTALHALCGSVGTFLLLHSSHRGARVPHPKGKERSVLILFSTLYTLNIIISNASLRLVTVPFHQCVRASAPIFVLLLQSTLPLPSQYRSPSRAKLLSLVPVVAGVGLATYGDYYFTKEGFALTLLGTLLAALKTIITNVLVQSAPRRSLTTAHPPEVYGIPSGIARRTTHNDNNDSNDTKDNAPPIGLSTPRSPFRFPSPFPAPIGIAHQNSNDTNSSVSSSDDTYPRTKRARQLSLSAFQPCSIDDSAPSIPLPPPFPHLFPVSRTSSSQPPKQHTPTSPTAQSAPPSPHSTTFPSSLNATRIRISASASSTAMTTRTISTRSCHTTRALPSFYEHHIHSPCTDDEEDDLLLETHKPRRNRCRSRLNPVHLWETLDLPRLSYTPLQLLYLLSPLAFIQCVALSYLTGELDAVNAHLHVLSHAPSSAFSSFSFSSFDAPSWISSSIPLGLCNLVGELDLAWLRGGQRTLLLLNGVLAFALNVVSFGANKRVGAVGMSVAANTKQALAVLLSITLFNLSLAPLNAAGIALALAGGAGYAWVEVREGSRGRNKTRGSDIKYNGTRERETGEKGVV